jgi:hypothetical protein
VEPIIKKEWGREGKNRKETGKKGERSKKRRRNRKRRGDSNKCLNLDRLWVSLISPARDALVLSLYPLA